MTAAYTLNSENSRSPNLRKSKAASTQTTIFQNSRTPAAQNFRSPNLSFLLTSFCLSNSLHSDHK
ncbi:MAG: hypothetical protein PHT37_03150 [Candidatus Cloacimonetes bacterium]|nr:hypothetical protein [Candidatus Cloacimonadota bacterium]